MLKVTNITAGPKGLNAKNGPVMIAPGQTVDVDFEFDEPKRRDAEIAASKASNWFTFEGQAAKETDAAYDAMPDDELRAILKSKGVVTDGRWGHDKLVAEAKKAQAAA